MNIAIILAGGTGTRMRSSIPKQFLKINDIPILAYTIQSFEKSSLIDKIIIVSIREYKNEINQILEKYNIQKFEGLALNGSTRQESVYNGLVLAKKIANDDDIVLIHDGVRAMITPDIINDCIVQTQKYGSTTLAEKTKNTMVVSDNNLQIKNFLDRESIYNIQTPQNFKFGLIYKAHKNAIKNGHINITDDTQISILDGNKVHIIENEKPNLKLTTKEDMKIFEYYLNKNLFR